MLDRSRLWILTPGINQLSRGESENPPVLSVCQHDITRACYGLSVRGLQLNLEVSLFVMKKIIPTPGQVWISIHVELCKVFTMTSYSCMKFHL